MQSNSLSPSVCRRIKHRIAPKAARAERVVLSVAIAAVLGHAFSAGAATYDWTPNLTGPFNWDNAGGQTNWSIAGFPNAPSDVANLTNDLIESQFIDLNQPITVGILNVGDVDGSASFTIQAGASGLGTLNFNNGLQPAELNQVATSLETAIFANVSTAGALNISNLAAPSIVLNGAFSSTATSGTQTVTVNLGNVRFAGDVSDGTTGGKIALVQNGGGTISLLGNNSFTGGVTLTSGNLNVGSSTALGTGTLTINGGNITNSVGFPVALTTNNTQLWAGDFSFAGPSELDMGTGAVTMTGDRTVSVNGGNLVVGGVVSDGASTFSLTKAGIGTLTLANANTYDGPTTINGGVLAIRNAGALGTNSQVTVVGAGAGGGTLQLEGGITVTGKALSIAGEGSAQLGALRSVGDNTWVGDITADTSAITRLVSVGGILTINGNIVTSGTAANGLVLQGEGVINGAISGDASVTRSNNDSGLWVFNGVNTYTGLTMISNGAIRLGNANAIQNSVVRLNSAANGLQFAAGIGNFNIVALESTAATGTFTLEDVAFQPVNLTLGSSGTNTTYAGTINGAGSLTKVGAGIFTLSNANTFTGGININEGIVVASDATARSESVANVNSGLGTGFVTLAEGTSLRLRANGSNDGASQLLQFTGSVKLNGAASISVDRQGGTGSNKTLGLETLSIGEQVLTVTGGSSHSLRFNAANLTGNATLSPTTASLIIGDVTETGGARSLTKIGTGRLTITGNTTHTGGTFVNAGVLDVAGSHAGNATVNGGTLLVTGTFGGGVTVTTGALQIGNGGYSGVMTGNIVNDVTTGTANAFGVLFNRADTSTYAGQISGAGPVIKNGSGVLVMTGANSYTGATRIANGTLMLDYSSNATILNSASALNLGGTLYIKGNSTGTTAQTIDSFSTIASLPGKIVLDNNGGGGTTLTIGNVWTLGGSNALNIDLSRGGTVMSNPGVTNNVVTGNGNVARITTTGADGRTYYATVSGGAIAPQKDLTQLTSTSSNNATNFEVSGDVVTSGATATATLRIDTTSGPGSLDISGGSLTFGQQSFLMDGSNDFEIKRTSGTGTVGNAVIHQYGTGALIYSAPAAAGFTKTGPGLLIGNMDSGAPGSITLNEGIYRIAKETAKPTGSITISGGTLELGSGNFTGGLGASTGQVRIIADGGFSAFGDTRIVNIGGAAAAMVWDSTDFLPNNATFNLSSTRSNATLDFQNALSLGTLTRTVRVFDGSAPVDAQLSGVVTGTGEFRKTGPGTLALTATNTFAGLTSVREGTLAINGRIAGAVNVVAGTLQGAGDGTTTGVIQRNVTIGNGAGIGDAILSPGNSIGTLTTLGALSLASDAVFKFEFDSSVLGGSADKMVANGISIAPGSSFQSLELAVTSVALALNTSFTALDNTSFSPIDGVFANLAQGATFTLGANTFMANYSGGDGNDLVFTTVVPEPGSLVTLLGCASLLGIRRFRRVATARN